VCQSGMGVDAGYTAAELAVAERLWPGKKKNNAAAATTKRARRDMTRVKCKTCKQMGHALVTSAKCKHNDEHKAWRATKPPKGSKFQPAAEELESDDSDDDNNESTPVAIDSQEEQTKRDASECDLMDSIPLDDDDSDGVAEFCDAFERFEDSNDSDKEN